MRMDTGARHDEGMVKRKEIFRVSHAAHTAPLLESRGGLMSSMHGVAEVANDDCLEQSSASTASWRSVAVNEAVENTAWFSMVLMHPLNTKILFFFILSIQHETSNKIHQVCEIGNAVSNGRGALDTKEAAHDLHPPRGNRVELLKRGRFEPTSEHLAVDAIETKVTL